MTRAHTIFALLSTAVIGGAAEFQKSPAPSRFSAENIPRDPFERLATEHLTNEAEPVVMSRDSATDGELAQMFRVTAFSIDRISIALINGKAFAEGENFTIRAKNKNHRVTVLKVKQNGVVLKCSGSILSIPLAR